MVLARSYSTVPCAMQKCWQRLHMVKGFEMMKTMHVAVLPVSVVVETAQYDGSAGTTGCRSTKAMRKSCAVFSQKVQPRRLDHGIAVTAGVIRSLVVHDNHHDIWLLTGGKLTYQYSAGRYGLKEFPTCEVTVLHD